MPKLIFPTFVGYDEDDDGSERASAFKEIYHRVAGGGKHGRHYSCNHNIFTCRTVGGKCCAHNGVFPYRGFHHANLSALERQISLNPTGAECRLSSG